MREIPEFGAIFAAALAARGMVADPD